MNSLLIVVIIIMLAFIIHGVRSGLLRMIYGVVAWIFLLCFVNSAVPYVQQYLVEQTDIKNQITEKIEKNLEKRYEKEQESNDTTINNIIPEYYQNALKDQVIESQNTLILSFAEYLSGVIIGILAKVITTIGGLIIIWLVGKIVSAIGFFPFLKGPNKLLGFLLGGIEGIIVIDIIFYIAECFPNSAVGSYVICNIYKDDILITIYENNIVSNLIG